MRGFLVAVARSGWIRPCRLQVINESSGCYLGAFLSSAYIPASSNCSLVLYLEKQAQHKTFCQRDLIAAGPCLWHCPIPQTISAGAWRPSSHWCAKLDLRSYRLQRASTWLVRDCFLGRTWKGRYGLRLCSASGLPFESSQVPRVGNDGIIDVKQAVGS